MSCNITKGLNSQLCKDTVGGVQAFYITNFENVTGTTISADTHYITGIDMAIDSNYYEFKPDKNTGSFQQNILGGDNQSVGYQHVAQMQFSKNEADSLNTIKLLAVANVSILVKERSGRVYMLGHNEGMQLQEGSFESGNSISEGNNWSLTFNGEERYPCYEVDPDILDSLVE